MTNKDEYIVEIEKELISTVRNIMADMTQHEDLGITGAQYHLLKLIEREGMVNVKYLSETLQVKPSAITVMVERLVQHGFVSRMTNQSDRRFVNLTLTEEGQAVIGYARARSKEVLNRYMKQLDEKECKTLLSILRKFAFLQSQS